MHCHYSSPIGTRRSTDASPESVRATEVRHGLVRLNAVGTAMLSDAVPKSDNRTQGHQAGEIGVVNSQPIIEAKHLNKYFGTFHVLQDICISVKMGERVVVCGPSGSGKSTLIRCFNALEGHSSGTLEVDGIQVFEGSKEIRRLRQEVGMVFQQFNLFPHLSVIENLMIGPMKVRKVPREAAEKTARKFLDRVHIPEQAEKYPAQLSGGQQQRVAIARALCMEPRIMLFDEPTSALDPEMINEVLDVMVELAGTGMTMVVVTHEMGFARKVADRMVFMEEGRIVEVAPPDTFFTNPSSERCRLFLDQILDH